MPILAVQNLHKRFGDIQAVRGVSFQVDAGEIYGLLGPNGAGKTTSISMINGLLRPDEGQIRVLDRDFWTDPKAAQRHMGAVPQEIALYEDLSGEENLVFWGRVAGLSRRDAKTRAAALLESLSLADRRRDLVKKYSGGMKRRINIGCALMHRPKLILLDEPTVGIDPQARLKILDFVRGLANDGSAVLYTTHYLEEAETLCNRIGVIDHGQLLAEGPLAELQRRLGGDQLFVLEGPFAGVDPNQWPLLREEFALIQKADDRLIVAARRQRHPSECLKTLLDLPIAPDNVTLKKPSLNDVFIQLTGRGLRE